MTMATIGIRELANHASAVVDEVNRTGRPALVTKNGRPVAVLAAIDEEELLDHALANAPEYVRSMRTAEREIARGTRGRPLDEVLSGLEAGK
jgi:prevent-host-death family protein